MTSRYYREVTQKREAELSNFYGILSTSWEQDWRAFLAMREKRDLLKERVANKTQVFVLFYPGLAIAISMIISIIFGIIFRSFWLALAIAITSFLLVFGAYQIYFKWAKHQIVTINSLIGPLYTKWGEGDGARGRQIFHEYYNSGHYNDKIPPEPEQIFKTSIPVENHNQWDEPFDLHLVGKSAPEIVFESIEDETLEEVVKFEAETSRGTTGDNAEEAEIEIEASEEAEIEIEASEEAEVEIEASEEAEVLEGGTEHEDEIRSGSGEPESSRIQTAPEPEPEPEECMAQNPETSQGDGVYYSEDELGTPIAEEDVVRGEISQNPKNDLVKIVIDEQPEKVGGVEDEEKPVFTSPLDIIAYYRKYGL